MPRAALAIAAALMVLFAQAGQAQAGFAPQNDTIVSTQFPDATGLATDSQGNSLVAWGESTTPEGPPYVPRARWLSPSGALGPVIDLALGGTGFEPKVAMAPSGRAFVAWRIAGEGGDPVGAAGRWVEPDGSLGQLVTFAPPPVGELDVAELEVVVDPAGVATVGMRNQASGFSQELAMRRVQPDGTPGPLITEVGTGVVEMKTAALPNGSTVAVWRSVGIQEAVLTGDLQIVPVGQISASTSAFGPGIAADSLGNALVAWRQGNAPPFSVRGRMLGASGDPLGEELIVEGDAPGSLGTPLSVAADTADDFAVAWSRQEGENNSLVKARTVNGSGAFTGPVQTLSESGVSAETPRPVLGDSGTGALVWNRYLGMSTTTALGRAINGVGAPTGEITELLGSGSQRIVASSAPAVGFAAFAITHPSGVVVRRFVEPPSCSDSDARVRQGKPITIPLACTGLAIDSIQVLSGTGHGSLGTGDPATLTIRYMPRPGFNGTDGFTFAAGNDGGLSNAAGVSIRVGKDTVKPRIRRLRFVRKRKRMRFFVKVSEPARLRIVVTRKGKKRKRIGVGKVRSRKAKRRAVLKVKGKLAKKLLAGGRFRATAVATDLARNKSAPKRLKFSIPR